MDVPRFSKIARSYLLHVGSLDWTKINPDIFGSMIQAVAEDEERGALGHALHQRAEHPQGAQPALPRRPARAGWRRRATTPASCSTCASASPQHPRLRPGLRLRQFPRHRLQGDARDRGGDQQAARRSGPQLRNPAHQLSRHRAARLLLPRSPASRSIIAEYQCDVLYRGQKLALAEFLPLDARELDHLRQRPAARLAEHLPADRHGREDRRRTICSARRSIRRRSISRTKAARPTSAAIRRIWESHGRPKNRKSDLQAIFDGRTKDWKSLDYVAGWFMKAADYGTQYATRSLPLLPPTQSARANRCRFSGRSSFRHGHEICFRPYIFQMVKPCEP